MEIFREIADAVEARWRDRNHDEAALPAIAVEALLDRLPRSGLTPRDVIEWVWSARELPGQDDLAAEFGQPPITVYRGSRFYIAVLFWLDATTCRQAIIWKAAATRTNRAPTASTAAPPGSRASR